MRKGWERKPLAELCEVIAGQSPEGRFYNFEAMGIPFYQGKKEFGEKFVEAPTTWTTKTTKIAIEGDILMSVRAPVGPVNFSTEQICIGRGLAAIRSGNNLSRDFLFYQLLYLQPEIAGKEGAVFASINKSEIEALPLILPPLEEQQRIVSILDEAFAGLASAQAHAARNLQNARALFESHLQAVFTQRGEGWVERRLGDIVTRLTNGYVGPTRNIYQRSGVPYLLARHVKNNVLTFDRKTFITDAFNEKNKKSMLKEGDVLLVQSGHIGHSAVVTSEHKGHNCHAMIVITPVVLAVTGEFLSLYFNSPEMRQRFEQIRSGSTVPHLTCGAVKEMFISIPDLTIQRRLVEQSKKIQAETQHLTRIYEQKLALLAALKKSLLHQAFSGEL